MRLVLEAQQKRDGGAPRPARSTILNIDAGSMWARKLIDRLVAAEAPVPGPRTIPLRPAA